MTSATTQAPLRGAPASSLLIVGLGLVGGSIARAARLAFSGLRVVGVDRPAIAHVAVDEQITDAAVALDDTAGVDAAIAAADLVVLALPVLSITAFLEAHAVALRDVVVCDTGATKRDINACARRLGLRCFIGGHPIVARAHGGLASSEAKLLDGARWFLCTTHDVDQVDEVDEVDDAVLDDRRAALTRLRSFVVGLGAVPVEISADDHDRDVALTSHVPHLLANVLAEAVLDAGAVDAAGGSLRAILNVAGAPFDVWGDTVQTNQGAIRAALDDVIARLQALHGDLAERERLRGLFANGHALRERLHG